MKTRMLIRRWLVLLLCLPFSQALPALAVDNADSTSVSVEGTVLRVKTAGGRVVEGEDLAGAVLAISFNGAQVRVRIDSVVPDPDTHEGDILFYNLQVIGDNGRSRPLCNPDPGGRRAGFPIAGRTDATGALREAEGFEFVCTSGAQGKCARLGYAPWRKSPDGRPMLDHFNACVRMIRADYCGDGRSMTRDGVQIGIADRIGINGFADNATRSALPATFAFEASWAPYGATCVARPRLPDLVTLEGLAAACPRLAGKLGVRACSGLQKDGLIDNFSRRSK